MSRVDWSTDQKLITVWNAGSGCVWADHRQPIKMHLSLWKLPKSGAKATQRTCPPSAGRRTGWLMTWVTCLLNLLSLHQCYLRLLWTHHHVLLQTLSDCLFVYISTAQLCFPGAAVHNLIHRVYFGLDFLEGSCNASRFPLSISIDWQPTWCPVCYL